MCSQSEGEGTQTALSKLAGARGEWTSVALTTEGKTRLLCFVLFFKLRAMARGTVVTQAKWLSKIPRAGQVADQTAKGQVTPWACHPGLPQTSDTDILSSITTTHLSSLALPRTVHPSTAL